MSNTNIDLKAIIHREGLRYTQQREEVWQEILSSEHHRDAEDIYFNLCQRGINISRATVYRTIDVLVKNNLVRKLDLGDGRSRFEHKNDPSHHDHLVCTACGKIVEFVSPEIEELQNEIAQKYGFKLTNHIHQLFGLCPDCLSEDKQ